MELKKYLLAGGLSTVLLLAACGETEDNTEEEETDDAETEEVEDTAEETTEEGTEEESDESEESTEDTEDVIEEETKTVDENLSIGDTVEIDGVEVTIENAYYTDERNEFADIEVDSVVMVDISFTNNTGEDYTPALDFEVYADGSKAETYPVGDVILESVSDGRTGNGSLAFGLVGEPAEIELEFSPMFSFSGEKAIYNIQP